MATNNSDNTTAAELEEEAVRLRLVTANRSKTWRTPLTVTHENSRRQAPDCDGRQQTRLLPAAAVVARVFPGLRQGVFCSKE
ncbi:uncharacterized protein DS421_3g60610 [Arachis hypogaea]|nr:uncharacterized protein DS421_3g60610 [Arachis hypogaea]